MGRWAQRRLSGGGPSASSSIELVDAVRGVDEFTLLANFSAAIDAGDFSGSDFETNNTIQNPVTVGQSGPNALELVFPGDTFPDTDLTYQGTVPGIITPQTVAIS